MQSKKFSLGKVLKSRDAFGHRIDVTYKGRETHNSITGGVLTLLVQVFTGFLTLAALAEVFEMQDPQISSFQRPVASDERSTFAPLKLYDYDYVLAYELEVVSRDHSTNIKDNKLPIEFGRLIAEVYDVNKGESLLRLEPQKCSEVLERQIIDQSQEVDHTNTKCLLVPSFIGIDYFRDAVQGGSSFLRVRLQPCYGYSDAEGVNCRSLDEFADYGFNHSIKIDFYESKTVFDFTKKENNFQRQMSWVSRDYLKPEQNIERWSYIRKHELEFKDSLIDPMGNPTNALEYIQIGSSDLLSNYHQFGLYYEHAFFIDTVVQVDKRVRYNLWMTLADVGGFRDGLYLIFSLFVGPIVAIFYENELL